MHREQIKELALANGFKLKPQPDGTEDLNPYVYEFAAALMAPLQAELKRQQDENSRLLFANRYNADMYRQIDDERKRLQAEVERLQREIAHLQIEVTNLRGLKPEIPPMPGEDWPEELPRYILRWNGHNQPTSVPYKDGYWTPWYLANRLYEELERERKAVKTAWEYHGDMKRERDQLNDELRRMVNKLKDALEEDCFVSEDWLIQHDADVIERLKNKLLEFAKKSHRHRGPGIEFAVDLMDDRIDQLRHQVKEVKS
jgi:hypothetical protein